MDKTQTPTKMGNWKKWISLNIYSLIAISGSLIDSDYSLALNVKQLSSKSKMTQFTWERLVYD